MHHYIPFSKHLNQIISKILRVILTVAGIFYIVGKVAHLNWRKIMHVQPNPLRAVQPRNTVDGFDIEIIRYDHNLLAGQALAEHFCNRYVQINASCNGHNSSYPVPQSLTLLVTQYTTLHEQVGIAALADVGIIVLTASQSLSAAGIFEINQDAQFQTVLMLWIKDSKDQSTAVAVYALAQKRTRIH